MFVTSCVADDVKVRRLPECQNILTNKSEIFTNYFKKVPYRRINAYMSQLNIPTAISIEPISAPASPTFEWKMQLYILQANRMEDTITWARIMMII